MVKSKSARHLYEIHTAATAPADNRVPSAAHVAKLYRLRDFFDAPAPSSRINQRRVYKA
jgi:hypothetical protein